MNPIDRVVSYGINRLAFVRQEWLRAFKGHVSELPYYLQGGPSVSQSMLDQMTDDEKRRLALTISWIYADIRLIANEVSSVRMRVKRLIDERLENVLNHPFEKVLAHPNSEMDMVFLLQYSVYWLSLRGKTYWFLAPERGDPNVIREIWPIQADRMTPIVSDTKFVEKYAYRTNRGSLIPIDPRYVVFLRYPNPYNLWDGLAPLSAAHLAMETEIGSAKWQKDTYVSGRGIPHSIISLDKNLGERDFVAAAQNIREDFEEERKVAITRAGDMDVKTVGISPRELELVKSRQFTRDEIDSIFLGVPIRDRSSDTWLAGADKVVKEKIIWPIHRLLAGQISVQAVQRFYEDNAFLEFDDIRPQDRSISVQEANIYWRVRTVNEAREELGAPKITMDEERFPGYGSLPVPLAIDPAFVTLLYDIGRLDPLEMGNLPGSADNLDRLIGRFRDIAQRRQLTPDPSIANLEQAESPKRIVNRLSEEGRKAELRRWRKVAVKAILSGGRPEAREFKSEVLSEDELSAIKELLGSCSNETAVRGLFTKVLEGTVRADYSQN